MYMSVLSLPSHIYWFWHGYKHIYFFPIFISPLLCHCPDIAYSTINKNNALILYTGYDTSSLNTRAEFGDINI